MTLQARQTVEELKLVKLFSIQQEALVLESLIYKYFAPLRSVGAGPGSGRKNQIVTGPQLDLSVHVLFAFESLFGGGSSLTVQMNVDQWLQISYYVSV